jgi:hypothetical protein
LTDDYSYKTARGSASKRLRGRCLSDFEVLLFFCNQDFQHYINLGIYPGQRLICVIDSFGGNALKYAEYIFRWLYDEMYFNSRKEWPTYHAGDGLIALIQIAGSKLMAMSAAFGLLRMDRA